MGRDEKGFIRNIQHDFKEFFRIKPQDGTSIRGDISDFIQPGVEGFDPFNIWKIDEIVVFPHSIRFFVNGAYFTLKDEPDLIFAMAGDLGIQGSPERFL